MQAQPETEALQSLPFGSVKPAGWLKIQVQKDLAGFAGNLDRLAPSLFADPIYSTGRLQKHSKAKDLGNLKSGDAEGDEQYKWWNSETQSNWWDGYIRNVFLVQDVKGIEKVKRYVQQILHTQDSDGYLGIYDTDLRYQFTGENGELWSKTTLYRGLLAYYEATGDKKVWTAVQRAVDNVMQRYPVNASSPFSSGNGFNGGVSHGLTFTDVLDRMYYHTKDKKYLDYALFLYRDFSNTHQSEEDAQLKNILNPGYKLKSHGVHTFEHLRPLIVARYASDDPELRRALAVYLERIENATTITGGAIGDEWIGERKADATQTGYEYCSLQELTDSYALMYQKSGKTGYGDLIETIFYNAAQGARDPGHSCIAYLKTDNSFEMTGTKNGEAEPGRNQTRYKYSPVHQDVAVCCSPNAGRITPYFIQHSWLKENDNTLVAALLMPNILETTVQGVPVKVENQTSYPYDLNFQFKIHPEKPLVFTLKIRMPVWVKTISTDEKYTLENGYIVIRRRFNTSDVVDLSFNAGVDIKKAENGEHYFSYGALVYAKPIAAKEIPGKVYAPGFADFMYAPVSYTPYAFAADKKATYKDGHIFTTLINTQTKAEEEVKLIPVGRTVLRQVSFR